MSVIEHIDRQLPERQNIWLRLFAWLTGDGCWIFRDWSSYFYSDEVCGGVRCEVWGVCLTAMVSCGVRCEVEVWWWRWSAHYWHSLRLLLPLPVSSDGPNWTFPLQLSPASASVSESSKCYTYNLQPTTYSLQPTSSIVLATSEEIRRPRVC